MKNIYSLALLTLLSGACTVSKPIKVPQPELPGAFRGIAIQGDSSSIADLPWRSFFTDAVLQQLIDSAVVKNYDMQIAIKNIESSRLSLDQVKWNYLPQANLQVSGNRNRPSDNSLTGLSLTQYNLNTKHIDDYSAAPVLSWEADIWGKIKNQQQVELSSYLQSGQAKNAIQTMLVASVSQGYYALLMLDEQLDIAHKNVRLSDSTLHMIKLQYDAGQVTSLAVEQSASQVLTAAQLVPAFEQEISIRENALKILTGELPGSIHRDTRLDEVKVPAILTAGIPAALVGRRPDVNIRQLALMAANAKVGISKAEMYPALRITASGGVNSFKASNWFNIPASLFGIIGGSIAQPVFQQRRLHTQYAIAKVEREIAVLQFRQVVLTAVGEVTDALVKIEKLKAQQGILSQRVAVLQKATSNANQLFKSGMANYLEVITAQSNVLQSELELATVKQAELSAVAELYRSLGGGWK